MPLIINGENIDPRSIDSEFSQIKAFYEQQANVSCCERDDEFLGYAKDNIVARVLLSQSARKNLDRPDEAAVDQRLIELKEQAGSPEAFFFELGIRPEDEASIRDDVANSLWLERYIEHITPECAEPNQAAIESYYQDHLKSFTSAEEVRAVHIFKSLTRAELREDVFNELRAIRKQVIAGEDFMKMVEAHSDKPIDEADLGFFKRGELLDEFELITFSLEVGDVSPVFATQWGMHLAMVTDRKLPAPIPLDEVREAIIEEIAIAEKDRQIKSHVEQLKAEADIVDSPDTD